MSATKEDQLLDETPLRKVTILSSRQENGHETYEMWGEELKPLDQDSTSVPPMDLEWIEMYYTVPLGRKKIKVKTLIHGLTGKAKTGELTAIVGPSGSGKTSLINCISGYSFRGVRGAVLVNGEALRNSQYRTIRSLVVQGECLLPYLTVQETMMTAVALKIQQMVPTEERLKKVLQIMDDLGLSDVNRVRCDRLTKTQRRKLFIAQDLVQDPSIIFLDEPTSGLDSADGSDIVTFLRKLADKGRTIVCSLQKPSAQMLSNFQKMYLLSEGHCCYEGSVSGLVDFLNTRGLHCPQYHNPADFAAESTVRNVALRSTLETEVRRRSTVFPAEGEPRVIPETPNSDDEDEISLGEGTAPVCQKFHLRNKFRYYPVSRCTQFRVLISRFYFCMLRDPIHTYLRLAVHIIGAILTGLLYLDIGEDRKDVSNNTNFIFVNLLVLTLVHLLTAVLTLPREVPVFIREQVNNWYSAAISYTARTVAEIPFQVVLSVLYGTIVYWMSSQPTTTFSFCSFLVMCVLTATAAHSLGIVVGVAFQTNHSVIFGPVLLVPMMVYSGFFRPVNQVPDYLQWMMYLSFVRYSYEGMVASIYPQWGQETEEYKLPLAVETGTLWQSCLALIVFIVSFRCMGYGAFKWRLYYR